MKKEKTEKVKKIRTKQEKFQLGAYIFALTSFVLPVIYFLIKILIGATDGEGKQYFDSRYMLMITQCLLGALVINVPSIIGKKFKFEVPPFIYMYYIFFLYCSIFLGEVADFYYNVPYWDSFLHWSSSLMLGFFGFMVITILNRDENTVMHLSPLFVCIFAFCFAVTVGALWEIYEFSFDGLLGLNMQKFKTVDGEEFVGRAALRDTMKDIITDSVGALIAVIIGYFGLKKNPKWLIPKLTEDEPKKVEEPETPLSVTEQAQAEAENGTEELMSAVYKRKQRLTKNRRKNDAKSELSEKEAEIATETVATDDNPQ